HVVCTTDDHRGPAVVDVPAIVDVPGADDDDPAAAVTADAEDEPTARLDGVVTLTLTPLERDVLLAYYADFALLPRPPTLEPRSHEEAARRLGRSKDSARKAIERVNAKIGRADGAPAVSTGRNVSSEIGRWLARTGALDGVSPVPG
ncbi:MAG TPA: hypothetical protein VF743_04985, partial [Acidimicrobiales bacterium]